LKQSPKDFGKGGSFDGHNFVQRSALVAKSKQLTLVENNFRSKKDIGITCLQPSWLTSTAFVSLKCPLIPPSSLAKPRRCVNYG
jgi:hypothetical protein